VWAFAEEQQLPKIVFINKMDRERADFSKVVEEVSQDFGINPTPVFFPIGAEEDFSGVVDLIKMKAYIYSKDADGKFETVEIPGDIVDIAVNGVKKCLRILSKSMMNSWRSTWKGKSFLHSRLKILSCRGSNPV